MPKKVADHPFLFTGCRDLRQMLGRSARDERQPLYCKNPSGKALA